MKSNEVQQNLNISTVAVAGRNIALHPLDAFDRILGLNVNIRDEC